MHFRHGRDSGLRAGIICLTSAILVGLLLTASARGGSGPPVEAWHRGDLIPVTQPVAIDGRIIVYDGSGGRLRVVALDARSGKTVWSQPAEVSHVTPGVPPWLDVSGSKVIALLSTSVRKQTAVVGAIDARTGEVIWKSAPGFFTSMPSPCPGEPNVVCVTGSLILERARGDLRFELETGRTLPPITIGTGARELGEGLLDPGLRSPDYLIAIDAGRKAWRKPLARIFGSGATSDYGWNFFRMQKQGLFVGSIPGRPLKYTSTFMITDLSKRMTAGFRISNGAVVWRNRGATFVCGPLPCAGVSLVGYADHGEPSTSESVVGLRLRMAGTLRITIDSKFTASRNANAVLEGFDPVTGRTTWSFDAGRAVGLLSQSLQPPMSGAERIVLRSRAGGYVDLDLRTGARHTVARTTRGWCREAIRYRQAEPYLAGQAKYYTYTGQGALYSCDATGKRLPVPARIPPVVGMIGATTDGVVAWSDTTGVVAVPAP